MFLHNTSNLSQNNSPFLSFYTHIPISSYMIHGYSYSLSQAFSNTWKWRGVNNEQWYEILCEAWRDILKKTREKKKKSTKVYKESMLETSQETLPKTRKPSSKKVINCVIDLVHGQFVHEIKWVFMVCVVLIFKNCDLIF